MDGRRDTVHNPRSEGAHIGKVPEKKKMKRTNSYFKMNITINSANFVITRSSSLGGDEVIVFRQSCKIYNYTCVWDFEVRRAKTLCLQYQMWCYWLLWKMSAVEREVLRIAFATEDAIQGT
jgi:hypothetical protein